jgi:hypothetical protein
MGKGAKGYELSWSERISMRVIRLQRWMGRRLSPFLRPGVLVVGVIAGIYAVAALLKLQDVPSADAWTGKHPLNLVLMVSGGVTAVFGFLVFYGYTRTLKINERDEDLENACKSAWLLTVRELALSRDDMDKLGAHVWAVRGLPGARYLVRRAQFTLEPRKITRVVWRKGTGAIGTAWDKNHAIVANVENLEKIAPDEAAFCQLDRLLRYGLTWSEFEKARHYRSILAIPLETRPDHVAGCFSLDLALDGHADALDTLSGHEKISRIRDVCEKALSGGR